MCVCVCVKEDEGESEEIMEPHEGKGVEFWASKPNAIIPLPLSLLPSPRGDFFFSTCVTP